MTAANGPVTVAAVLVAAGAGQRLGADVPKAFIEVGGRPLLVHAAQRFTKHQDVRDLVLVVPADRIDEAARLVPDAIVVAGGATRQESVAAGLAALADDIDTVLVHDVARPFVPPAVITRVLDAVRGGAVAVVPVVAVTDTIRRQDQSGALVETLDRAELVGMQTPQGFSRALLDKAHVHADNLHATDDAALAECVGAEVVAVAGADESFKITTALDLALAEAFARGDAR